MRQRLPNRRACCGRGNVELPLRALGHHAIATDLATRGCADRLSRACGCHPHRSGAGILDVQRRGQAALGRAPLRHNNARRDQNAASRCARCEGPCGVLLGHQCIPARRCAKSSKLGVFKYSTVGFAWIKLIATKRLANASYRQVSLSIARRIR